MKCLGISVGRIRYDIIKRILGILETKFLKSFFHPLGNYEWKEGVRCFKKL
ncbi:hypothetical protein [Fusobacterium necrophorum]|uniref:Uncharacterized protein n=1 Tax=Fusobacterium necrophorum subsp. funduliforme Fnf 1007 TaxID=1161424 RepID=A0AAN3VWM6_9FUSO|nr:hypothetical protein HMPREF1127_0628 [Fusobacterium necrophorum subsp. funduliforme Fnf 1007]